MTATSAPRTAGRKGSGERLALAVADANWFTTENLFREVGREGVRTLLLSCMDYVNAWRRGRRPWSWGGRLLHDGPDVWRRELVLPSGWMKRFPRVGMRPIGRSIGDWKRRHAGGGRLVLVMTYPHYLYLRDQVRPERSVYFNIDDYALYWPRQADRIRALERRAVRESDLTVCVSKVRAEELRAAVPEAAERVRHLPHGSPSWSLAERPWHRPAPPPDDLARLPRPILGYVGSLGDRVDWALVTRLSETFPRGSVVLIGNLGQAAAVGPGWLSARRHCLARPNVHALGWRGQREIPLYYRAFDVCLIPYRTDHPFNRACSPTKISDCLATGRPIVSTALSECRLYGDLFDVADSPDAFVEAVRSVVEAGSDDGRAPARHDHARRNTCAAVVGRLLDSLPG
jgi:glycosyltransferase involved in cell wall biosynthesis